MRIRTAALLALLVTSAAWGGDDKLEIVLSGGSALLSKSAIAASVPSVTVTIEDPVYARQMTFDAFPLAEVLKLAGAAPGNGDELVFQARDGYAPTVALAELAAHPAYLAYGEHGLREGFAMVSQGKARVSPAPWYLVWGEGRSVGEAFPWPYQLVKIEVVDFERKYAKLYPATAARDSSAMRGFRAFKTNCLRCHSVNLEGGDLGPELNIPKNVTEYWSPSDLRAFIGDASSFHARSKMPAFEHLLAAEGIEDVVAYLTLMRAHKLP